MSFRLIVSSLGLVFSAYGLIKALVSRDRISIIQMIGVIMVFISYLVWPSLRRPSIGQWMLACGFVISLCASLLRSAREDA